MSVLRPVKSTSALHPELLQLVSLTLRATHGTKRVVETRVLDVEPQADGSTVLVVACPEGVDPDEHHFDATVAWTYPLGRMDCAVSSRPGRRAYGRVWLLRAASAPTRDQQRAHFRARLSVPVTLAWRDMEPEETSSEAHEVRGVAVDLSEGGLLCTGKAPLPPVGRLIDATLNIDGEDLTQRARVVRRVGFAGGGRGVALAFLDPAVYGDRIRSAVFEADRRRRRVR